MKKIPLSCVACAIYLQGASASAVTLTEDFQITGSIGALSEYSMRGISYTQRKPALQATATLAHSSGLYVGVWSSNVDNSGIDARYEADYFAGYTHQFSDDIGIDVGYIKYTFPKGTILNAGETYAVLNAYGFKLGTYYSDDYYGDQSYIYNYIGYGIKDLPYGIGMDMRYGVADYKDPSFLSQSGSTKDSYREWEVKFSKNWMTLDWSASYVDTNLSETECLRFQGDKESCSARMVVGVSKSF
ncbi:TorF family putative porin [Pseudomonas syringae]|uniref:TorF family putative porin n=1 Tax=Pseudomonas syringae TaxID=317 RepID=UPI001F0FBD83|nr:TorF family putative porin [Pseudomonas syringae]MCH5520369.1 TorF family putative porin [Pseudomonas syringae pv. lapsa]